MKLSSFTRIEYLIAGAPLEQISIVAISDRAQPAQPAQPQGHPMPTDDVHPRPSLWPKMARPVSARRRPHLDDLGPAFQETHNPHLVHFGSIDKHYANHIYSHLISV